MTKSRPSSKKKNHQNLSCIDDSFDPLLFDLGNTNHIEFLQIQGETELLKGNIKGIEFFEMATRLDVNNTSLYKEQANALFSYGKRKKIKKYLLLACKKLKSSLKIDKKDFESWHLWGNILIYLGRWQCEKHYFNSARDKLNEALLLIKNQTPLVQSQFYFDFGKLMLNIAEDSNEGYDLHIALKYFKETKNLNDTQPTNYWITLGETNLLLGEKLNDLNYYHQAVYAFKHAVSLSMNSSLCWRHFARALTKIYLLTYNEDDFEKANDSFANSAKISNQNYHLWKDWATLLLKSGTELKNTNRLYAAIEKCKQASMCKQNEMEISILWTSALTQIGTLTDSLDILYEANNKIASTEKLASNQPDFYYASGLVLSSLGSYFQDPDYYFQAIEKFQEGLSINRNNHKLWYQLAKVNQIAYTLDEDPILLERALRFYKKAIKLRCKSHYFIDYAILLRKMGELFEDRELLQDAIIHFEQGLSLKKDALYINPKGLFEYATTLDTLGDELQEKDYYFRALEIFNRILVIAPSYANIHYSLALTYAHIGELEDDELHLQRSISHFKLAAKNAADNEDLLLDWALVTIQAAESTDSSSLQKEYYKDAEFKLIQSAKLGNTESFYHLACLYSIHNNIEQALFFLEKARQFDALPSIEEIKQDEWLENLQKSPYFEDFISSLLPSSTQYNTPQ